MATGRVNVGGGGGNGINVYAQQSEPIKKEGIWIQTDTPKRDIINDLELWFANAWNDPVLKAYADVPYGAYYKTITSVGSDIYLLGGYMGSNYTKNFYKYDTLTDTWTKLADFPLATSNNASMAVISSDIYVIITGIFCKYDILTNTWTQLASASTGTHELVAVGTDIYSFWTSNMNYTPGLFKYDISTNTWSVIPNGGYQNKVHVVAYGTDIYMIGAGSGSSSVGGGIKKYNTIDQTYTSLGTQPIGGGIPVVIGNDIHVFFGSGVKHYVYSIDNNTWTLLDDSIPIATDLAVYAIGKIVLIDNSMQNGTKNFRYNFTSKVYEDGTIIVYRTKNYYGRYQTELLSLAIGVFTGVNNRMLSGFDNVFMYANGDLKENLPTYYGDGTKWVQFKGF